MPAKPESDKKFRRTLHHGAHLNDIPDIILFFFHLKVL